MILNDTLNDNDKFSISFLFYDNFLFPTKKKYNLQLVFVKIVYSGKEMSRRY